MTTLLPRTIGDVSGRFRWRSRLVREILDRVRLCRLQGSKEILYDFEVYLQTQQYIVLRYGIIQLSI